METIPDRLIGGGEARPETGGKACRWTVTAREPIHSTTDSPRAGRRFIKRFTNGVDRATSYNLHLTKLVCVDSIGLSLFWLVSGGDPVRHAAQWIGPVYRCWEQVRPSAWRREDGAVIDGGVAQGEMPPPVITTAMSAPRTIFLKSIILTRFSGV